VTRANGATVKLTANPIRMSNTTTRLAPPSLGQDTNALLTELLGANETDLARLRGDGVI
jgi:crotonobetainyl-CoA:carnitine CoA-transferase CaiB-like acyl-CoA transferase